MKKVFLWLLVISMIVVFSLVGCKEEAAEEEVTAEEEVAEEEVAEEEAVEEEVVEEEPFVVGFIPRAFVSMYFVTMGEAMDEYGAEAEGIEVQTLAPLDQKDIEGQIKMIEDFTEKDVDLLAVSVNDPSACVPSLLQAQAKGIPIVLLDTQQSLEGIDVLSLIGSDHYDGGVLKAEYLVEKLGEEFKVVLIEGVAGQYANEARKEGMFSVWDNYPGIEIVAAQPGDWDRAKAMAAMENIIQSGVEMDVVIGMNDNMALGAMQALEASGMLDEVLVIGYNADEEAVKAVKDGKMHATVKQQPSEIARMTIEIAKMIKEGNIDQVESIISIPLILVTEENVDEFLAE